MGRREAAARTAHVRAVLTRAATGKGRSVTEILLAAYAGERNARRSVFPALAGLRRRPRRRTLRLCGSPAGPAVGWSRCRRVGAGKPAGGVGSA